MNKSNLQRLKILLKSIEENNGILEIPEDRQINFDMHTWSCGTAACALGCYVYADPDLHFSRQAFMPQIFHRNGDSWPPLHFAQEEFGLDRLTAENLFLPDRYPFSQRHFDEHEKDYIPVFQVIEKIDNLLENAS